MKRLLLYVHFNKYNTISSHVEYQLMHMRPLFSKVVFISNSILSLEAVEHLQEANLIDAFIQRENSGFDFAAWRDGMNQVGFSHLEEYDSVTLMNDTCFGPLWDMEEVYHRFESDERVDFWGMTNHRETREVKEHIQSYFVSFKHEVICSPAFQDFWSTVQDFTDVQEVIDHYETQVTTSLVQAGFRYQTVFNTIDADTTGMRHPDFSYYNPTSILSHKVPFIKVKAFEGNQIIAPFILEEIGRTSDYPVDLIIYHMSKVFSPTRDYLLGKKYHRDMAISNRLKDAKVAIHLHTFYVDLLEEFLDAFEGFVFTYDLYLTTNTEEKIKEIQEILDRRNVSATIRLTGNIGRDVLPMLQLKEELAQYEYVGHFHTKKSKEADYWAGQSWRTELIDMLVKPSNEILSSMIETEELGMMIADIPSYFRYVRMDPWAELGMIPFMEELWEKMALPKQMDFYEADVFVMSYGTYIWFKYDALKPLFEIGLTEADVPKEPLPQNTILHAIERLLVYIAWAQGYDFRIRQNPNPIPPFVDNRLLNRRQLEQFSPYAYIDFTYFGGVKGALKYLRKSWVNTFKYLFKRLLGK
ncbi:rhamnan synthesis F family protein [Streptococcus sp. ZJ93]|uniref:rhamnan synthesis F family protein n=1 Tax=Streptococcus handemini TaxID=3161188 RepID=UPI0032EE0004